MSASPRLGPLADEVIDERYTVERQLGEGGMGAVFLARHNVTGRRVALKWVESDGRCIEAFMGATHCFKLCTGPADCHAGLTCTSFDDGEDVCIPDGWMDGAPLEPPM